MITEKQKKLDDPEDHDCDSKQQSYTSREKDRKICVVNGVNRGKYSTIQYAVYIAGNTHSETLFDGRESKLWKSFGRQKMGLATSRFFVREIFRNNYQIFIYEDRSRDECSVRDLVKSNLLERF